MPSFNKVIKDINEILYKMIDSDDNLDYTELFKYLDGIKSKVTIKDDDILDDPDLTKLVSNYINKKKDKDSISKYINKMANFSLTNTYNVKSFSDMSQWTAQGMDPNQGGIPQSQPPATPLGIDPSALGTAFQDPNGVAQQPPPAAQMGMPMDSGMIPPQGMPNGGIQTQNGQMMGGMPPQGIPQEVMMNQNQPQIPPGIDQNQINQIIQYIQQTGQVPPGVDPNILVQLGVIPPEMLPQLMGQQGGAPMAPEAVPQQPMQNQGAPQQMQSAPSNLPGQVIADEGNFKAGMIPGEKYTTAYVSFSVKNGYNVNLYKLPRNTKISNFSELVKLPSKSIKVQSLSDILKFV